MTTDSRKGHCLKLTKQSACYRRLKSNQNGNYYDLNSFNSYATENKLT